MDRNATSFRTGGSGTAKVAWEVERQQAGLQYQPKLFDPDAGERPSVFAMDATHAAEPPIYQHLRVKPSAIIDLSYGLIFARAVNGREGRIVSLGLTLAANRPRSRE